MALWCFSIAEAKSVKTYHDEFLGIDSDTLIRLPMPDAHYLFKAVELRGSAVRRSTKKPDPRNRYGVVWDMSDSANFCSATLRLSGSDDDLIDSRCVELTIARHRSGCPIEIIKTISLRSGVDAVGGDNSLAVELSDNGQIRILAGNKSLNQVFSTDADRTAIDNGLGILIEGSPDISLIATETIADPKENVTTDWDLTSIEKYFATTNRPLPEGRWTYLDRNNDPQYARPGGKYQLAVVATPGGGYDILYIDGASTGSSSWTAGMRKGRLTPTVFSGHFDLVWYDSTMQVVDAECNATLESASILRLDFPLLKSSMRFSLLPQDR